MVEKAKSKGGRRPPKNRREPREKVPVTPADLGDERTQDEKDRDAREGTEPKREDIVIEGPCSSCATDVRFVVAGDSMPFIRQLAIRQRDAGALMCEPCGEARERAEEKAEVEEQQTLVVEKRRRLARLPAKWEGQTFDALDVDAPRARSIELARGWAAGSIRGLVLWGAVGRGKTAIAAAAANARLDRAGLRWLAVSDLLLDLRMPFDSPEYLRAMRQLDESRGRAALVLDDLDKLKPTEHAVQPLYVAVNGWVEAELPLLVTLNRDLDALADWMPETFGEAIASRLAGYCKVREVGGRDRRLS